MENRQKIDCLKAQFPLYSEDLGINLRDPDGRFRWFLASILFGARISERIAARPQGLPEGRAEQPGEDTGRGLG
jgi:hypothetical protein